MKKLKCSVLLLMFLLHSFVLHSTPSQKLVFDDQFAMTPFVSMEGFGFTSTGDYKFTGPVEGRVFILATEGGSSRILEWSILENQITGEYEVSDEEGASLELSEIFYNLADGFFYALAADHEQILSFEYAEDELITVIVTKTRMIEVPVEVEEVPEESVEGQETAIEEESVLTEEEVEVEESADATELDGGSEEVSEELADAEETFEEVVEEGDMEQAEKMVDEVESETAEETVSEDVSEPVVEDDTLIVIPEAPKTQWVEETYETEEEKLVSRKFGKPVGSVDITEMGIGQILDTFVDDGRIILLTEGEEGLALKEFSVIESSASVSELFSIEESLEDGVVFKDPVSKNWVIFAGDEWSIFETQGRFVRLISESNIGLSDVVAGPDGVIFALGSSGLATLEWTRPYEDVLHRVPAEFPTVQNAVDAASPGDWVLLAPGSYSESVRVSGKSVKLSSYSAFTGDLYFNDSTILSSENGVALTLDNAPAAAFVYGLTIADSRVGIQSSGNITLENSLLRGNGTGLFLNSGTAVANAVEIKGSLEDGIHYSGAVASLIENSVISENGDNGIRIDITPYEGLLFRTVIRKNEIKQNEGSGIYFEDAPIVTQREFRMENNFLIGNGEAGIEVFYEQPDPRNPVILGPRTKSSVFVVNNTIVNNSVGVLRGGNLRLINNIIAGSEVAGVQDLRDHCVIIRNLFWENEENSIDSNFNTANNVEEDPMFVGDDYILSVRSPAVRAGIPGNLWNDTSDRSGANIGATR